MAASSSCCGSLACLCSALLLPCLFTWGLTLIVINKYDEVIFPYPQWISKNAWGGRRGRESERRNFICCVCSLHVWDILHMQKLQLLSNASMMSIYTSTGRFQAPFSWELGTCGGRNRRDSESLDHAIGSGHPWHVNASGVNRPTCKHGTKMKSERPRSSAAHTSSVSSLPVRLVRYTTLQCFIKVRPTSELSKTGQ